jgi:hypothetical protein
MNKMICIKDIRHHYIHNISRVLLGGGMIRSLCSALVALSLISACSNIQTKDSPNPYGLSVGDTVVLVTKNSAQYEFEITELTDSAIVGESVNVPLSDIKSAKRKEGEVAPTSKLEQISVAAFGYIFLLMILVTPFI